MARGADNRVLDGPGQCECLSSQDSPEPERLTEPRPSCYNVLVGVTVLFEIYTIGMASGSGGLKPRLENLSAWLGGRS